MTRHKYYFIIVNLLMWNVFFILPEAERGWPIMAYMILTMARFGFMWQLTALEMVDYITANYPYYFGKKTTREKAMYLFSGKRVKELSNSDPGFATLQAKRTSAGKMTMISFFGFFINLTLFYIIFSLLG